MTPPTNNPGEGNPAAERPDTASEILDLFLPFLDDPYPYRERQARIDERLRKAGTLIHFLDAALLHERRATVERIRERAMAFWSDEAVKQDYAFHPSLLFGWLDATASEEEARP